MNTECVSRPGIGPILWSVKRKDWYFAQYVGPLGDGSCGEREVTLWQAEVILLKANGSLGPYKTPLLVPQLCSRHNKDPALVTHPCQPCGPSLGRALTLINTDLKLSGKRNINMSRAERISSPVKICLVTNQKGSPTPQKRPEYRGRKQKINRSRGPKFDPIENPKFIKRFLQQKDKRVLLDILFLQHSFWINFNICWNYHYGGCNYTYSWRSH